MTAATGLRAFWTAVPWGPTAPAKAFVSDISRYTGPDSGGWTVEIYGSYFLTATKVLFGGVPATSFTVIDDDNIIATVPAGIAGREVDVVVVNSMGASTGDITDDFEKPDSTFTLGAASNGSHWTPANWPGGSVWGITGGSAYLVSNGNAQTDIMIDTGYSEGTAHVTLISPGNNGSYDNVGISFRGTDYNNLWRADAGSGGSFWLANAGPGDARVGGDGIGAGWATGDVLSVEMSGTTITMYRNGSYINSISDSRLQSGTKMGLRGFVGNVKTGTAGTKWGAFRFAPPGVPHIKYFSAIPALDVFSASSGNQLVLSWSEVGADTYTVRRNGVVIASGLTSETYTDSVAYGTYSYTVTAVSGATQNVSNTVTIEFRNYEALVTAQNPIARWRLNESTGTTATDTATKGVTRYNGTYTVGGTGNNYFFTQPGPIVTDATSKSTLFNNTVGGVAGSHVTMGNVLPLSAMSYSIEGWFKTGSASVWGYNNDWSPIIGKDESSWQIRSSGGLNILDYSAHGNSATSTSGVRDTIWHYFVATYDNTAKIKKLYIDGRKEAEISAPNAISTNTQPVRIAYQATNTRMVNAYISEVAIYDRVLTDVEIKSKYEARNIGPEVIPPTSTPFAAFGIPL